VADAFAVPATLNTTGLMGGMFLVLVEIGMGFALILYGAGYISTWRRK